MKGRPNYRYYFMLGTQMKNKLHLLLAQVLTLSLCAFWAFFFF